MATTKEIQKIMTEQAYMTWGTKTFPLRFHDLSRDRIIEMNADPSAKVVGTLEPHSFGAAKEALLHAKVLTVAAQQTSVPKVPIQQAPAVPAVNKQFSLVNTLFKLVKKMGAPKPTVPPKEMDHKPKRR